MRKRGPDSVEDERLALIEQRETLAALQRQLAERVEAVRARELELREAIGKARPVSASPPPTTASGLRPPEPRSALPPSTDTGDLELDARLRALDERERAVAVREEALATATARLGAGPDEDTDESVLAEQRRLTELEGRERTLTLELAAAADRERELAAELATLREEAAARPELPPTQEERDASRTAEIAARLDELRAAEKAFERTREELLARSEAVAARERLVSEREREVAEQADGWGASSDLHELESRLRRLEHQKSAPQPAGFSSGIRKLEQQSKRKQTS